MTRARSRLPLLLLALALPGCGAGSDAPRSSAPSPAPSSADRVAPLTVAATDGSVGDATTASPAGVRALETGRRRTRPGVLEQGVGAGASCPDADTLPSAETLAAVAAATVCLVNGERADAGLPPLAEQAKLRTSSLAHSEDMVAGQFFAHESRDGRDVADRVRAADYIPRDGQWTVGENLAWGTGTLATPKGIVAAWMNSQGHRENILRPAFREAGLGVVLGNPRSADGAGATYTMNFGAVGASSAAADTGKPVAAPAAAKAKSKRATARRKTARAKRAKARRARAARARRASRR